MHTALECEVTIKPRFVYIPSPRTGPVRGGAWESRDGWGGRAAGLGLAPGPPGWGASVRSCYSRWRRAGERRVGLGPAECAAGGRGDPRPSACGPAGRAAPVEGCPGFPRPPYGDPGPEAGPRGSSAGGNGRQPLSSSGPTEKARWGAREPWRSPWVPEPGRGATMARPRALFPGTGVQGGVGAVGRGGKWPARRGVLIRSPPRSSLGGGGVFGTPQPGEASGVVTWKGFLRLLRRRVHVGACPHGPSLRSWARGRNLTAGRPAADLEGSFTQVSAPSDTKHELKASYNLPSSRNLHYVFTVKCGN